VVTLLDDILSTLGPRVVAHKPNGEIICWCPFHPDGVGSPPHNPNLTIKPGTKGAAYVWGCPVCNVGGTLLQLAERLREIGMMPPRDGQKAKPVASYDYRDETGRLLYQVLRFPNKRFAQRRPDGKGGWLWNLEGVRRTLYRLPELLAADAEQWAFVVEGEKDADDLARLGLVATTNSGGAGKWGDDLSPHLAAHKVAILPDNDAPGQAHASDVAAKIAPHAADVRIVNLPALPPGGDVSDWLAQGRTAEELAVLVEATPSWEVPPAADLAVLLDDVRAIIRHYVIVDSAQADALALWVAHTHALAAAEATPYLAVNSAEKRSGKTRLLETLSLLVARPWLTGRVTAAVLIRKLAAPPPTLLLDESDAAFKAEKEYAATLQAILNSGYRRGGCASLCVKAGGDFDLKDFPVFGPKAIAGIGSLPDTIADRAITIALKRRAPNETIARFRWRDAQDEAKPTREGLACWASANIEALAEARPDIPSELDDRAADVWEPLFAIADVAGGEWPQRARTAALALSVGDGREDDSLGVRLLADIRAIFGHRGNKISTAALIAALVGMEEAPWGDLPYGPGRGKALEARTLARRLRPYEVKSHNVRFEDGSQAKGYEAADFDDAWTRYVYPEQASQASQGLNSNMTDGTDGTALSGIQASLMERDDRPPAPCPHRLPGEVEDRWTHGDGGCDAHVCACCGGPVAPAQWQDGLCAVCRNGQPVSGHLVRLALDMGATLVEKGG